MSPRPRVFRPNADDENPNGNGDGRFMLVATGIAGALWLLAYLISQLS